MQFISSISLFLAAAIETNGQQVFSSAKNHRALSDAGGEFPALSMSMASGVEISNMGSTPGTSSKAMKSGKSGKAAADLVAAIPTLSGVSCADVGASCTTVDLLTGVGRSETNTNSDTIDACRDGVSGTQFVDESIEMITVSAVEEGQELQAGTMARIEATIHAFNCTLDEEDFPCDYAHFYTTSDTTFPATWEFLETRPIADPGLQTLEVEYTLPEGSFQAVRVAFAFLINEATPCPPSDFSDVDDVVFSVAEGSGMPPAPHEAPAAPIASTIESRTCSSFGKKGCSTSINCEWSNAKGCSEKASPTESMASGAEMGIGHTGSGPGMSSKSGKSMGTCAFNNESLHGTFSLFSTSGDTASVAVVGFDGEGTLIPIEDLTGDFPDPNGGRMPAAATINNGSYEVGPNGRGQITMSLGPEGNPFFDGTVFEFVASQTGTDGEITELSTFIVGGGFGGQLVAPTLKKICD